MPTAEIPTLERGVMVRLIPPTAQRASGSRRTPEAKVPAVRTCPARRECFVGDATGPWSLPLAGERASTSCATTVAMAATMSLVEHVEVVLANNDRVTLRVGDVFLKIDADQSRTDVEVGAMAMAPVPTPKVLWRNPPVLALAAVPGRALGRLGEPSTASPAAWAAAGAAIRTLHDAPLPPWPGKSLDELAAGLAGECEWLVANEVLPADVDRDLIRAWRSWRCLTVIRWLFENGYGPPEEYPEVAVLRSHS